MFRYALIGVLMLGSTAALADGLSYSYIQASYQEVDIDFGGGINADGDGFGVAGSVEIAESWFLFADYSSFDFESVVDFTSLSAGAGWHTGISDQTDFFATFGYAEAEIDVQGFGSVDDSGYGASIGVRSMVSDSLELYGSLGYVDLGNGADGTAIGAGLWYSVSGNMAVGLGASFDDDVTAYGVGFRLYFDK